MDFTIADNATKDHDDGLDDLKKKVIEANIKGKGSSDMDDVDVADAINASDSNTLDALRDISSSDTDTFSMDDVDDFAVDMQEDHMLDHDSEDVPGNDAESIKTPPVTDPMMDVGGNNDGSNDSSESADLSKIFIEEGSGGSSDSSSFMFDDDEVKKISIGQKIHSIFYMNISTHSLTLYIVGLVVLLLSILGSAIFYYAERYVYYSTRPYDALDETAKNILDKVDSYRDMLITIGLVPADQSNDFFLSTLGSGDVQQLSSILSDPSIGYIEKYDYFHDYLNILNRQTPDVYQSVVSSKEELASYPFFPDLVQNIIDPNNESSLQRSLLSLEGVKFRTAVAVFSKFDTFVRQFALATGRNEEEIATFLEKVMSRGDTDIDYYLNRCYLNPYEDLNTCMRYGDFNRVYDFYEGGEGTIDTVLFAQMMGFVDDKLENSVLPSLSLSTRDFDPVSQNLTLVIDVNTLPDDTLQLLQKGILNPHVYVVGSMINFLRQSKFIVSKNISINELKINQVIIPVGSKDVTVSTSHFEFTLPLQKNTEREITDYFIERRGDNSEESLLDGDIDNTINGGNDRMIDDMLTGSVIPAINDNASSVTGFVSGDDGLGLLGSGSGLTGDL